jgi:hypothetical protein
VLLSTHNRGMGGTSGRRRGPATVGAAITVSGGCAARRWAARATAAGCPVSRQRRRGVVVVVRVRVHGRCVFGVLRVHVSYECRDREDSRLTMVVGVQQQKLFGRVSFHSLISRTDRRLQLFA